LEGPDALPVALTCLEGFEAPASAWETEILPARIAKYEPAWLDAQCLSGQRTWARLVPSRPANGRAQPAAPVRSTPIALLERRHVALWMSLAGQPSGTQLSPQAQHVCDCLAMHGALFFDELADAAHLLRSKLEDALAELVALGLVNSDSFGGLRALLVPSAQRKPFAGARRRGRVFSFGMEGAGRWSLIRREPQPPTYLGPRASRPPHAGYEAGKTPALPGTAGAEQGIAIEYVARTLLRRYGVVFWRLLTQEASWLPPWRDLLRVYRRLEARGEIRGGRFVAGFSGEQYALPEAVGLLRKTRRQPGSGQWVSLSAADPLNLVGILTPGPRLAALTSNRLIYRDGVPIAVLSGGKVQFLETLDAAAQWEAQNRLLRSAAPAVMADLA
jgi:ATP-dependent Lhr-like helicase